MSHLILVVDDTFETRSHTQAKLESEGYQALTAVDGVDALKVLKDTPQIDLILTDYRMPSLGGKDLLELLDHHYPDLKKIVISGYPFVENQLPKNFPLIAKPIDWDKALKVIHKALND